MPDLAELSVLTKAKNLILYEDAGSGAIVDLSRFGLTDEPVISESIKAGVDVVTFSGDKLLGAVQAGVIVGRAEIVEKIRKHPLYRALRADKIVYAALSATLEIYRNEKHFEAIPVLQMLSQAKEQTQKRAQNFIVKAQKSAIENIQFEIINGESAIGGGSAPLARLETALISLRHNSLSSEDLERTLRLSSPPVICRIAEDRVLLDLRTVFESEEDEIVAALRPI
jgi:L-seryl-tRNA(Ser) seleniumtransferase